MDENRNFNTTPEYIRHLEWLVRRNRNHPCVILWSVFNEEPMQGTSQGYEMVRRMVSVVKRLDSNRPVTAAQSNSMLNAVNASQAADIAGFNYQHSEYERFHAANPTKPIISSEDTSAVMTRDEYVTDRDRAVLASYDTEFQPWGTTHRKAWKAIAERPFVAGGFVWTGFDYRGEPQPLEWPATGSSFGCMDLCGFPKTAFYIHQAHWIDDRPILQICPPLELVGHGRQAHQSDGVNECRQCRPESQWKVSWRKTSGQVRDGDLGGALRVWQIGGYGNERRLRSCQICGRNTGPPVALQLIPDRTYLAGDGCDAQPITVKQLTRKVDWC